jgi:hypothetical protein
MATINGRNRELRFNRLCIFELCRRQSHSVHIQCSHNFKLSVKGYKYTVQYVYNSGSKEVLSEGIINCRILLFNF